MIKCIYLFSKDKPVFFQPVDKEFESINPEHDLKNVLGFSTSTVDILKRLISEEGSKMLTYRLTYPTYSVNLLYFEDITLILVFGESKEFTFLEQSSIKKVCLDFVNKIGSSDSIPDGDLFLKLINIIEN